MELSESDAKKMNVECSSSGKSVSVTASFKANSTSDQVQTKPPTSFSYSAQLFFFGCPGSSFLIPHF